MVSGLTAAFAWGVNPPVLIRLKSVLIRYFGDFERFSAISEVAAEKRSSIHARISQLLENRNGALDYGQVADIARAADDVVVSELESWQAV